MGTWDTGPFDNDTAADWVYSLESAADSGIVEGALAAGSDPDPDVDDAQRAIAAAEVAAAGLGRPHTALPDPVASWVAAHPGEPWPALVQPALDAVRNVRLSSELAELWAESDDDEWLAAIDDLERRLNG